MYVCSHLSLQKEMKFRAVVINFTFFWYCWVSFVVLDQWHPCDPLVTDPLVTFFNHFSTGGIT